VKIKIIFELKFDTVHKIGDLELSFAHRISITLLQNSRKLVDISVNALNIVTGESAPPGLEITAD
jgi:hypothetical protein